MNHCTTGHEDSVGTALIKEALEGAYESGLKDAGPSVNDLKADESSYIAPVHLPEDVEDFPSEVEETAWELWVDLVKVLKIDV